jgi:phosphomevalonate decarboxylase
MTSGLRPLERSAPPHFSRTTALARAVKATARAHPIQGLIKYHGLADFETRQPLHDSISVCVAPLATTTTVEPVDGDDEIEIDGTRAAGRARERAVQVLDRVREIADSDDGFRVVSRSTFPQGVGLGSSSSGFAALAEAAQAALGLGLDTQQVARVARLGAGSATRATAGGVADWYIEDDEGGGYDSTAKMLAGPGELDWPILMALVDHEEHTENVHRDVMESPLLAGRETYVEDALADMREALAAGDRERVFELAERDTLSLHAVTMTGERGRFTWQPATVAVARTVWQLRDEDDVPAWFSIDTGATPYINTLPGFGDEVAERLVQIDGVEKVLRGRVGGPVHRVDEHLF